MCQLYQPMFDICNIRSFDMICGLKTIAVLTSLRKGLAFSK